MSLWSIYLCSWRELMMGDMKKCLNEWNATIEALGSGKQSILIRKNDTTLKEFLLYPTISYTTKHDYANRFKAKYKSFVEENSLPNQNNNMKEVKYYAKVESIIQRSFNRINGLSKYHIWTNEHVKSYLNGKNAHVWVLRIYKLKNPTMAERTRGLMYANLLEGISLDGKKPVLSDSEFNRLINQID